MNRGSVRVVMVSIVWPSGDVYLFAGFEQMEQSWHSHLSHAAVRFRIENAPPPLPRRFKRDFGGTYMQSGEQPGVFRGANFVSPPHAGKFCSSCSGGSSSLQPANERPNGVAILPVRSPVARRGLRTATGSNGGRGAARLNSRYHVNTHTVVLYDIGGCVKKAQRDESVLRLLCACMVFCMGGAHGWRCRTSPLL